ncbi:anthranilate phosphoribosyltransferase [Enterobacteriaceae endosymbiont of Donacia tomentosa]|uniref:anthranilate phosphoribosyltransferase n=1 Tax=Enterobacteriaceae endosymbiont of Donacia tomentosa TaxID=2675787 RepID=UPI001449C091|nr:anthranilate phosphoribosyltransferase [Enterobacteriaceae endosymbiont of Donacia tomentosa]QJC31551.1 anthranilate phosphoribosyltransferase [Enterobacteriaceae endosymbiont of Donacia tomentosa]
MINIILNKLYDSCCISKSESNYLFSAIFNKKLNNSQIIAALIALKVKGESMEEIIGLINAIKASQIRNFPKSYYITTDIVGTGGDKLNTLNISTSSAFIAAACGIKIVKHTNYYISGLSGSANILELLGFNLNQPAVTSKQILDKFNLCFLFAPNYYKCFKQLMPIRKELKTRTILNIIGPLINPAKPKIILIGVFKKNLLSIIINILKLLKYKRAAVVYCKGMDEISLHDITHVFELKNNQIFNYKLKPKHFGLKYINVKDLEGQSINNNTKSLVQLLKGQCQNISYIHTVAANVAFLLKLHGQNNLIENTKIVIDIINSGISYNYIINLIRKGYIKNNYVC